MSAASPDEPDELTACLLAARAGDRAAAAAFVRATQPEIRRLAGAVVGPEHADDVTQDVFLRAFRSLPQFAARSAARTWLLTIARRACVDHIRALVRSRRVDAVVDLELRPAPVPDPGSAHATNDLVRRLPHDQRVAFTLTQVLGLSYAEAAEVEGVPIGTIRSRVARARADLVAAHRAAQAS
ncbi:sigma-70 family RNA polymerase sigma factor [Dactylosporangium siamense]|uniref:RNA polymerase sigma factor n=1 Tax=Dactylosporangium siamense TaxID=685454 RepID=A0A919PM29_9ACTN|nr:sigma-70 family RNA polymerase sigma factor [Dactylosporangium siamense]GIG44915.1 RNA polymerase sigma factor [Dactylosporangium siamense]